MTEISVTNTDWTIIAELLESLRSARIAGEKVFADVAVTTSAAQAAECQLTGPHPKAILCYDSTSERESPAGVRSCTVNVEFLIAAKVASRGSDETDRLREILRLLNAARNAVEASPPEAACYWGDGETWRNRLGWGRPSVDAAEQPPWALAKLPLEVSYTLAAATSH